MPLLVTGGTGYLGQAVVRVLSQQYPVRLLVRDTRQIGSLHTLPRVHVALGDLQDQASLMDAVKGCEAVFHIAALVKSWVRDPSLFEAVNVEGFRKLVEASWKEGVKRFVYTSSFLALGPTEEMQRETLFENPYEASKKKALALARDYQKKGYPLVTVIPTILYGPGAWTEGNHISRLLKDLLRGRFPGWIDGGKWRWNFAYLEDVAEGHRAVFEKGKEGEEYVLGGEVVTLREFFMLGSELTGVVLPKRELPLSFLQGYAAFQEALATLFGHEPAVTRGILATYRHDWAHSDEKARKELGYVTTPLETALRKTLAWLKE